ncbi:MAG: ABC transporter permease [Dermatophilaceae bacterium]
MSSFAAMTRAQGKGFLRDRQMLFWTIAFPLMFLVVFGGIFGGDTGQSRSKLLQIGAVALFDRMPAEGRAALDSVFDISRLDDRDAALDKVRKGDAAGAVEMQGTVVQLHYSQADQVRAAIVQGTLESFVQQANLAVSAAPPTFTMTSDRVEDTSLKPIQFYVPGLLSWAVAMSGVFGAAMALVTWRKSGLLRRLRLSPASTSSIVGSRVLITLGVAIVQAAIFLVVGVFAFGLKLSGSWYLAIPVLLAGALAFMSIGLLTGAVSKTPEGASGLANLIIMPMAFLSGTFIPLDVAPAWMRTVSNFLPMGHLTNGMSAVMVRGQGIEAIWLPMLVLLGFALLFGAISARVFRWEAG